MFSVRTTKALERREEPWERITWHEGLQQPIQMATNITAGQTSRPRSHDSTFDLSGDWDIHEDDKSYRATLNAQGNGPYTHEQGVLTTINIDGQRWSGTWAQKGNDREGGFEVFLSEDAMTAEGMWWYTRVGKWNNIPPRLHGGSYFLKRISSTQE